MSRPTTYSFALLLLLVAPAGRALGASLSAARSEPAATADPEAFGACAVPVRSTPRLERDEADLEPPANLRAGAFQALVDRMWRDSPTFRRQCQRLASRTALTVRVRADPTRAAAGPRAATVMTRRQGTLVSADVVLFSVGDATELIAHEIEHVIEQLDEVSLTPGPCRGTGTAVGESCRAVAAGRRVARETQEEAQRPRLITVPLADAGGGALGPADAAVSANGRYVAPHQRRRERPLDGAEPAAGG